MIFLITLKTVEFVSILLLTFLAGIVFCKYVLPMLNLPFGGFNNQLQDDYTTATFNPLGQSDSSGFFFRFALVNSANQLVSDFASTWDDTPFTDSQGVNYLGTVTFSLPTSESPAKTYHEYKATIANDPNVSSYKIKINGLGNPPDHDVHDPR